MSIIKLNNKIIKLNNKFETLTISTSVTDIDGNVYNTVTIGTQTWMTSNLKVTKYNDGTPIPNLTGATEWATDTTGAYAWYNNNIVNKPDYGGLYNWHAVNTGILAPTGYHIPTSTEWNTLITYIGGGNYGGKLKSTGFTYWDSPNTGAIDSLGMGVRGAGIRQNIGAFNFLKTASYLWATTQYDISNGDCVQFDTTTFTVAATAVSKNWGQSIRCIKNI
jgi:uncharacterized protein (TIGR02145 family)